MEEKVMNEEEISSKRKTVRKILMVLSILVLIVVVILASIYLGLFRKGIPDANPVVAAAGRSPWYGGHGSVSVVFDDHTLYTFDFQQHWNETGYKYESWYKNDLTISSIQFMVELIDCPKISYPPYDRNCSMGIESSERVKLTDEQYQNIINAIEVSNYTELDDNYSGGMLDSVDQYIRIWNNTSSKLIHSYGGKGPDELISLFTIIWNQGDMPDNNTM